MSLTKNWRTSLGGACTAAGTLLVGGPVIANWQSVDIPTNFSHGCLYIGFGLMAFGAFWGGLTGRDAKVSDEEAGAGVKPKDSNPPLTPKP